jgi:hypothetical protein
VPRFARIALIILVGLVVLVGLAWVGLEAFLHSGKARAIAATEIGNRLGSEVRIDGISSGTSTTAVTFALPGKDAGTPLLAGTVRLDKSIYTLARGAMPSVVTLADTKITLHLDKDGKILDPLPNPPKSESKSKEPLPEIHVEAASVRVIQEGRPEFHANAVDVTVKDDGSGHLAISGKATDDAYGSWTLGGNWATDGTTGEIDAKTDGKIPLTQERIKAIPLVPAVTWDTVGLDGEAALAVKVGARPGNDIYWHVVVDADKTRLQVFPAKLDMADCSAVVTVDGAKVKVEHLKGTLADGTVTADSAMDFGPTPAVLTFDVRATGVDVKKTPPSWGLAAQVDSGTLKGDGKITLKIPEDGKIMPSGSGKAVIDGKLLGGTVQVEVYLEGDGERLKFVNAPTKTAGLPPDLRSPFVRALVLMQPPPVPPKESPASPAPTPVPKAAAKKSPETQYVRANLTLTDIDIADLLKRAKVTTPVKVGGKVSLKVSAEIPTNNPGSIAAYRATGKATSDSLQIEGLTLKGVTADVTLDKGVLTLDKFAADFLPDPRNTGGKPGSFLGTASFGIDPRTELKASLTLTEIPLNQASAALPGYADAADGILSGKLTVTMPGDKLGVIEAVVADGVVTSPGLSVYGQKADRVAATFALKDGVAKLTKAEVAIYDGLVTGEADVPIAGVKTGDFNVVIKDLNSAVLAKSIPNAPVTAAGKFSGKLAGTLPPLQNFDAAKLAGTFNVTAPSLVLRDAANPAQTLALTDVGLDATIDKGFFTLKRVGVHFPADPKTPGEKPGSLVGTATYGLQPRTDLKANLKLDNLPLTRIAALVPGYANAVGGLLSGNLNLVMPGNQLGVIEAATADGSLYSPGMTIYGQKVESLAATFALKDAVAKLTKADIALADGMISGTATVPIAGAKPGDFDVVIKNLNAATLALAVPDAPVSAEGKLSGTLKGTLPPIRNFDAKQLAGTFAVTAPSLVVRPVPAAGATKPATPLRLADVALNANIVKGFITLDKLAATFPPDPKKPSAKPGRVLASGSYGLAPVTDLKANLTLDNLPLKEIAAVIPGYADAADGLLSGHLNATLPAGKLTDPAAATADGTLTSPGLTVFGQPIDNLAVTFALKDGVARLAKAEAGVFEGTITAHGDVPLTGTKNGQFAVNFKDVNATKLTQAIPNSPVSVQGKFSGKFVGSIPPVEHFDATKLTGNLDIDAPSLIVQGIPATKLAGKVGYKPGAIAYDLNADALGGKVAVEGTYPLTADAKPVDPAKPGDAAKPVAPKKPSEQALGSGTLKIDRVRLGELSRALRNESLRPLRGELSLNFNYEFGPAGPTGGGKLLLRGLGWGATAFDGSDLETDIKLTPNGLVVPGLSGLFAGGVLRTRANYDFDEPRRSRLALTLDNADAALLAAPLGFSNTSGRVSLTAYTTLGKEIRGGGTVTLVRAKVSGVPVSEFRLPYRLHYAPGSGIEFSTRDAAGTVGGGRVTLRTDVRYTESARVDGRVEFNDVNVAALAAGFGASSYGIGRTTGQFDFTGANVRSVNDLGGTLIARFGETTVAEIPIINSVTSFLSPVQSLTRFNNGDFLARLGSGQFRIERLALAGKSAKLFADGTVGLNGRLDLNVVYSTEQVGPNAPLFRLVARNIPAIGPIPVALIIRVSEALSNRVVPLTIGGTTSRPVVSVNAAKLLSQNAVRFFVNQYNPISDFTP